MPEKYVCIHAHLYQPPRENPWLDEVETEESAAPFHDWNERVTYECYTPNTAARILDRDGRIKGIASNYEHISFNFGPTLLSWMERHQPDTYQKILEADRLSVGRRNGHGNAIAQVYNHSIMPLNSPKDKETQIIWGIRDFQHRFGRAPEGIWFAEAAVDSESLALAAKHGIKFTILSPRQAKRVRPVKPGSAWTDCNGDVDTTRPYLWRSENGEEIALFFYDGGLSLSIAFEGALFDGVKLGNRFLSKFPADGRPRIVHIATDGESYGHHHKFGEMALASAIATLQSQKDTVLTNYGHFLELHPPEWEAEIVEDSSWSCAHGVERWRSDCGCSTGSGPGWNQKWRAPLREALDHLKERIDAIFEESGGKYLQSPWDARNDYIDLVLHKSHQRIEEFFLKHQRQPLTQAQITEALKHLEMQRLAMTMYTSCGWFFNDVSGIETVQIMKYAAKAMDMAQEVALRPLEEEFLGILKDARSNVKQHGTGADIFRNIVAPLRLNPMRIAAHAIIISSLWKEEEPIKRIYSYKVEMVDTVKEVYLDTMILLGMLELTSQTTLESKKLTFCLLHLGAHDFNCFIHPFFEMADYSISRNDIVESFRRRSIPDLIHSVERHFGQTYFTIKALFNEERRRVMDQLMAERIGQFAEAYQDLFNNNRKLMDFHVDIGVPIPDEFKIAARYVFEKQLNGLFTETRLSTDGHEMARIFREATAWDITLKPRHLRKNVMAYLEYHMERLCEQGIRESAKIVLETLGQATVHGIESDFWKLQNMAFPHFQAFTDPAHPGHAGAMATREFGQLFDALHFSLAAKK
ncbi:MAG: DUF3536 domain-containing protein [Nitrospinae bacterium]|nr:DUF3536 domain-containing protein [Nitrospinota bacterium]